MKVAIFVYVSIQVPFIFLYKVSHFRVFYGVSCLLVELQRCSFYITVLLLYEIKNATYRIIVLALLAPNIQGEFENYVIFQVPSYLYLVLHISI